MKAALDTNILAYAEGVNSSRDKRAALAVIAQAPPDAVMVPVQALGELFTVLIRKAGRSAIEARAAVLSWRDALPVIPTSARVLLKAMDLAADHQFGIWDAIMFSAAVEAGCRLLLSEDLQDGFTWGGTTVVNPFSPTPHPQLAAFFRQQGSWNA